MTLVTDDLLAMLGAEGLVAVDGRLWDEAIFAGLDELARGVPNACMF